jgi:hypothetical protein
VLAGREEMLARFTSNIAEQEIKEGFHVKDNKLITKTKLV